MEIYKYNTLYLAKLRSEEFKAEIRETAENVFPKCRWALIVGGSLGRGEMLEKGDQDNAIIYDDLECGNLEHFCKEFVKELERRGYPPCKGGYDARNLCMNIKEWRDVVEKWKEQVRGLTVFLDGVVLAGDKTLGNAALLIVKKAGEEAWRQILLDTLSFSPPLSLLGKLKGVKGYFDFKIHAIYPYVNVARALAISKKVKETSTYERLKEGLDEDAAYAYEKIFEIYWRLRLSGRTDREVPSRICVKELKPFEREMIEASLRKLKKVRDYLSMLLSLV